MLCTNPAALGGGAARVDPIVPSAPFAPGTLIGAGNALLHLTFPHPATEFAAEPGAYRARCSTAGGASVLNVAPVGGAQVPTPAPSPEWGLHLLDATLSQGNLVNIVSRESKAYVAAGGV